MKKFFRNKGLSLVMFGWFLLVFVGQPVASSPLCHRGISPL